MKRIAIEEVLESRDLDLGGVATHARGPAGALPLTPEMLLTEPSGNLFGMTMNAGMGWDPARMGGPEFLILSTHGGLRAEDGTPIALGFHTGHWEVGLLVAEAARELKALDAVPFAGACTDPCDGRTQGTTGMLDSLPYRNDAAMVLRRLMRSLPTRAGVLGVATCDKGLPAMMMALASSGKLPAVLIPGGVTLLPESGEDAGKIQTIGARFAQGQITLEYAAEWDAARARRRAAVASFWGRRRRRRWLRRRWGWRCRTRRWLPRDSRYGWTQRSDRRRRCCGCARWGSGRRRS